MSFIFLGFMRILGIIFLYDIVELQKDKNKTANLALAGISLLMMIHGIRSYFL